MVLSLINLVIYSIVIFSNSINFVLTNDDSNPCHLPKQCQLINIFAVRDTFPISIKCSLTADFGSTDLTNTSLTDITKCEINNIEDFVIISFYPESPFSANILGEPSLIHLDKLKTYIRKIITNNVSYMIRLNYLQGFQAVNMASNDTIFDMINNNDQYTFVEFYKSKFEFFTTNNKRIESCEELGKSNLTSHIFQTFRFTTNLEISFNRCEFKSKVCPFIFNNTVIHALEVTQLIRTFLKTNILSFEATNLNLNLNITIFELRKIENIVLNRELLNEHVFASLREIYLDGNYFWIERDVFKSLKNLKKVSLQFEKEGLFRSIGGIEWMQYLNMDVNVSLNEISELVKKENEVLHETLSEPEPCEIEIAYGGLIDLNVLYPDEDFCLYKNFPFHQLVFIHDANVIAYIVRDYFTANHSLLELVSCSFLWLIQFYPLYIRHFHISLEYNRNSSLNRWLLIKMANIEYEKEVCNFEQRLNNCMSDNFPLNSPSFSNSNDALNLSYAHMVFIFLIPVVCAFGIITSILVIRTIPLIKKDPELKDRRHYDYMRINAATNCGLFVIKIIGLINECTAEFWCSQINRLVGVQYYKLIFGEMLGTSLRFFSNFTYVAFQLCRLSLIGQEHGWLVEKVSNKMSIKRFVGYFVCFSLVLSVVKYFRFQVNDADFFKYSSSRVVIETSDEYPIKFTSLDIYRNQNPEIDGVRGKAWAFIVLNCMSDLLNYPIFLIVCLVLDIVTARELRKALSQKIVTSKQVEDEKEEAIFKSTLLIVLNAASNFLLKSPMTISSIFEIIVSLKYTEISISYEYIDNVLYFIMQINGGDFFENLCNFLYFLSISIYFVFYYNFDRMFKFYFRKWFLKETPSTTQAATAAAKPPRATNKAVVFK